VNRDDLRAMLVNGSGVLSHEGEQMVTVAQKAQVRALLAAGVSVVVDDTNLRLRFARDWADLARDLGVEFFVWDFKADREQCISNDEKRAREGGRKVGTLAIADMAHRFPQPWPKVEARPVKDEHKALPYVADPDLPDAWVIDIDGTAAIKEAGPESRGYYDWDRVGEDLPNPAVIQLVNQLSYYGDDLGRKVPQIIFLSGRKDETGEDGVTCFKRTQAWLEEHLDPHVARRFELYLGAAGDSRDDRIVKAEMFDAHVRNRFNVIGVVDDRPKVCRMWREMGLNVLQVGDPHVEF
jgi:predicted kinase